MNADTAAPKDDFAQRTEALLKSHGAHLLGLARRSIETGLNTHRPLAVDMTSEPPELAGQGASFVTLKSGGRLRGCIGSPEARQPLAQDVAENAFRAAFHDPRFAPLREDEAPGLNVHISVLSPAEPMTFSDEDDLLSQLVPSRDGLIIQDGPRRALFLPSVWEQLPTPETFLAHLKTKAGLAADHFSSTFKAERFVAPETGADWGDIGE